MSNLDFYLPSKGKNVFHVADPHAFHKNICEGSSNWNDKSGCRPFVDEFEMTEHLANIWNKTVGADDILFCIGDWAFGNHSNVPKFRSMINCKNIVLILGNHDKAIIKTPQYQSLFAKVMWYNEFWAGKNLICQSHYPLASWNDKGKGGIMLHGHVHGNKEDIPDGKILDVGVDVHDHPLHTDEIFAILDKMPESRYRHVKDNNV